MSDTNNTEIKNEEIKSSEITKSDFSYKPKPVTDLSQKVIRLARMIDRLPYGCSYTIRLSKGSTKEQRWIIELVSETPIRKEEV